MNSLDLSSNEFHQLSERILEISTEYLQHIDDRAIPTAGSGVEIERAFRSPVPEVGLGAQAINDLREVARYSRAQNARFFAYVMGSGELAAAASELLCGVLNQNVTIWRSSPAGITLERTAVDWLAQAVGCSQFSGTLTSGGSSANLMALAIAREAKAPANEQGLRDSQPLAVYASTEVHMSIAKAVALLGIGRKNLRMVPVDNSFRMNPQELEQRIRHDRNNGVRPLAIVATAGSVNTGAIDPLTEISEIATGHGVWLHVDGSYGALAAIAVPEKFTGLALADSISLDPHKWLYQPLDCGCLLYRDATAARIAFSYSGDYVRALTKDPIEAFAIFEESIELSRRFRALKLWFSLRYHGLAAFRNAIHKDLRHAARLGSLIERNPRLEMMAPISLSALCFRYKGHDQLSEDRLNGINLEILRRVIARGRVYLSNATLQSKFCLRACVVNHRTTDADIDAVLTEVLSAAEEVVG